jgi:menaquinol-cytochrome c reductase iron-sulfur subunit
MSMDDQSTQVIADRKLRATSASLSRRDFLGMATAAIGGLVTLALAIPGLAYVLSPLRRKSPDGALHTLARLRQLEIGVPRSFAIIEERQDSWVRFPREPVGSVWLIRQPAGSDPPVLALQSECPHLGCAINLNVDRTGFLCPCHTSAFTLEGTPTNQVPPRPMDRLEVEVTSGEDPEVRVKFQRFRTASEEKIPLA